jgi:hypothetical protein
LRDLTTDEGEVVELQMTYFSEGKICSSSQTDQVVVIQDEQEIIDLVAQQKETRKETTEVSTQTDIVEFVSSISQTDPPNQDLAAVHQKLDDILAILQAGQDNSLKCANVSDIVRWVAANTSTPQPGCSSVTIVPVEETVLEIPATERCDASPLHYSEREDAAPSCSMLQEVAAEPAPGPSPPIPVKRVLFDDEEEDHGNTLMLKCDPQPDCEAEVPVLGDITHRMNRNEEKVMEAEWSPTKALREIKDINDIVPGDLDFRIRRDVIFDTKARACSDGNFMWLLTKLLFREEELIGRNFFGRKGRKPLSPRRKKCLKHAYMVACGTNYKDFTKAINSVNNGIRSLGR